MTQPVQINVTDSALRRIQKLADREGASPVLRVSVEGGGCSGFSYQFAFADDQADDDLVIERDGVRVLIDAVSIAYMDGSEIDFVDDLIGQSFKINNPNASSSCGCGTSFSI